MKMGTNRSGFTLVEVLVVIVIIAILATVASVAYQGIQNRARVAVAKSDLKTLGTTLQLYQTEVGSYPRDSTELLAALERQPAALRLGVTDTGPISSDAPKSFTYCHSADGSDMWIVAWKPVTGMPSGTPDGAPVYYWHNGQQGEASYQFDGEQAGSSLCKAASDGTYTTSTWSYSPLIQK